MPDFSWLCNACGTTNPPYTELCRDCGAAPTAVAAESLAPSPAGQAKVPAQRKRRSPVVRAFVIAASICAAQLALTVLGLVVAPLSALQAVYFITALPAMVVAMVAGSWQGGILTWLSLSFLGYAASLMVWAALYFSVALWTIKRGQLRD